MPIKLYLAGPDIFLHNAAERATEQRQLCTQYGFIPLHPLDNNLDVAGGGMDTADRIYRADIAQIRECDIVVANCNPFRSHCVIDDGTAYELGFGNALGKPSYGYITERIPLTERTIRHLPTSRDDATGMHIDNTGHLVTDDFGTSINLMMECGMRCISGRLVEGGIEECLQAIRADLDRGILQLS
ncbi:nucleoside 2-deoxyribosyltransferase [Natronospira sp.]|uniref:nucleoside 2-deoxyribosyltransferase n=1 Tax=Natronospira sp. TaxID=2024970 RepID=UPI003872ECF7